MFILPYINLLLRAFPLFNAGVSSLLEFSQYPLPAITQDEGHIAERPHSMLRKRSGCTDQRSNLSRMEAKPLLKDI